MNKPEETQTNLMLDEMDHYYKLSIMTPEEKEAHYAMRREALNKIMNIRLRGTNNGD